MTAIARETPRRDNSSCRYDENGLHTYTLTDQALHVRKIRQRALVYVCISLSRKEVSLNRQFQRQGLRFAVRQLLIVSGSLLYELEIREYYHA